MSRQEQMDMLKKEYEEIEVPEAALKSIQNGIDKAKQEKASKSVSKRKSWGRWAAAAAVIALIAIPNISPRAAMAVDDIPVLNKVVQVVTLNRYQQADNQMLYAANVEIPQISVQGNAQLQSSVGEINAEVQAYAEQMIAQFQKEMEQQGGVYGLDIFYNVVTDTDDWFALQVDTVETMASGVESVRYYNLDKQTGGYVKLADLFPEGADYVEVISTEIKAQMKQRMADNKEQVYFIDSEEMPEDDFKQIAADQSFYINQQGQLVIVFNEYEVAPGYMGTQQFVISKEVIDPLQ